MDAVTGLLGDPRARGAFLLRSVLNPPWSLRIQDEAPLTVVAVVAETVWVTYDSSRPVALTTGDVAIMRGPDHYTVSDDPTTAPQIVIHPGQRCATPDGRELSLMAALGPRSWGNDARGATVMLTGTYTMDTEVSRRLLRALPALVTVAAAEKASPYVELLAQEIVKDQQAQAAVLDRLLDLVLIDVLRTWFDRREDDAPGWCRANDDPCVAAALRLMHDDPARQWGVESLAQEVGTSRAAFARRFAELVGEPPMAYLTRWRLDLAADLLREPTETVGAIATKVGYSTPFALSAAFKRARGVSPREHRRALAG